MLSALQSFGHGVTMLTPARSRVGFHVMATGAGFESRENEVYSWRGLRRGTEPYAILQHTVAGRGELEFEGRRHPLLAGTTMVLLLPHDNHYWLEPGNRWEYFWIGVNGREALRLVRAALELAGPVLTLDAGFVDRMAVVCLRLMSQPELPSGEVSSLAYAAVMTLHDGVTSRGESPAGTRFAPVIEHIGHHLSETLQVDELARVAGMSRAHFVRSFTREVGQPPSEFVLRMRIDRAMRMLTATDFPVWAIAAQSGFREASYFAKVFRRFTGVSPLQWRRG